jgi:hypothetical protein
VSSKLQFPRHRAVWVRGNAAARNGIFRCRDGEAKTGLRDRKRLQRPKKTEQCRRKSRQKRPISEQGRFRRFRATGWWGQSGPNCMLPTQSSNRSLCSPGFWGRLSVSLVLKSQFGRGRRCTSTAITRDVGDHAFLKCNLLNLARHATQIHQYAINLGHPHQRVVIQ